MCWNCRYCVTGVSCPSPQQCIGCSACFLACPHEAIRREKKEQKEWIVVRVNDQQVEVPADVTIKVALESIGHHFSSYPKKDNLFAPCQTGGCYACSVVVDGELRPSCHTSIKAGQVIQTQVSEEVTPLRIVGWYQSHAVGGVGTPWPEKSVDGRLHFYAEAACFAAGCNLRCRTCQNHTVTYDSAGPPVTPQEAARDLLSLCRSMDLHRMAISGGEATLNRPWLLDFFLALKDKSKKGDRLHLDTNATILTKDYIDALVEVGMTDIGPDVKAVRLDTFQTITGIEDSTLAKKYLDTQWTAVKHLADNYYPDDVFMGVGLPFNPAFYKSEEEMNNELHSWASRIVELDNRIQVTILDYRPEFRRRDIKRPYPEEMSAIKGFMEDVGLRTVIAQTLGGHLAPNYLAPDRVKS
ncbi:MAG: radical SAM protein [Candidatus Thorarchaeota archaeon]